MHPYVSGWLRVLPTSDDSCADQGAAVVQRFHPYAACSERTLDVSWPRDSVPWGWPAPHPCPSSLFWFSEGRVGQFSTGRRCQQCHWHCYCYLRRAMK